ncbi:MAG: hypothetical protein M0Z39_03735, partial [Actinomycetota bacterium]|nr:hypothetical protein [Actinomycetota bacterium]
KIPSLILIVAYMEEVSNDLLDLASMRLVQCNDAHAGFVVDIIPGRRVVLAKGFLEEASSVLCATFDTAWKPMLAGGRM